MRMGMPGLLILYLALCSPGVIYFSWKRVPANHWFKVFFYMFGVMKILAVYTQMFVSAILDVGNPSYGFVLTLFVVAPLLIACLIISPVIETTNTSTPVDTESIITPIPLLPSRRYMTASPHVHVGIHNSGGTAEEVDSVVNQRITNKPAAPRNIARPIIGRKAKVMGNVKSVSSVDLEAACTICMSTFKEGGAIKTLQCGHTFHSRCMADWNKTSRTCPVCRECSVFHIYDVKI